MGLAATHRYDRLDALRGAAIVWMTVFHFCYDLDHFGWLHQNFLRDPFWTLQRTAIVSLFLFCAGAGQAIALAQGQGWPRFWKRWAQVAGCALLVTAGSWFMFPRSYIFFGVLHGIAVMLVLVRLTAGWDRWLWPAGALALLVPVAARAAHAAWPGELEFLNQAGWHWLGLVSRKPVTEDYVPLFPWLGLVWWGVAAMQEVLRGPRGLVAGPLRRPFAPLSWLGRWSLSWYMLHQPVLIGLVAGATALLR